MTAFPQFSNRLKTSLSSQLQYSNIILKKPGPADNRLALKLNVRQEADLVNLLK